MVSETMSRKSIGLVESKRVVGHLTWRILLESTWRFALKIAYTRPCSGLAWRLFGHSNLLLHLLCGTVRSLVLEIGVLASPASIPYQV